MTDSEPPCCMASAHGQKCNCLRGITTIRALEIVLSRLKFDKRTSDDLIYHLDSLRSNRATQEQT